MQDKNDASDNMLEVLESLTPRTVPEHKVHEVLTSLFEMKSLRFALQEAEITAGEFFYHLRRSQKYSQVFAHIQEIKAEVVADEIIEIADTEPDPLTAKNRISARTWYASKIKADKFGDKLHVTNVNVDLNAAITEANERRRSMLASYKKIDSVNDSVNEEKAEKSVNVEEDDGVDIFS